jgi:hypothetical protein
MPLVFDLIDLVIRRGRRCTICENAGVRRGAEVFERGLRALRFPANRSGRAYYAHWAKLSANDYGVPETFEAVHIGIRQDVAGGDSIDSDAAVRHVFRVTE